MFTIKGKCVIMNLLLKKVKAIITKIEEKMKGRRKEMAEWKLRTESGAISGMNIIHNLRIPSDSYGRQDRWNFTLYKEGSDVRIDYWKMSYDEPWTNGRHIQQFGPRKVYPEKHGECNAFICEDLLWIVEVKKNDDGELEALGIRWTGKKANGEVMVEKPKVEVPAPKEQTNVDGWVSHKDILEAWDEDEFTDKYSKWHTFSRHADGETFTVFRINFETEELLVKNVRLERENGKKAVLMESVYNGLSTELEVGDIIVGQKCSFASLDNDYNYAQNTATSKSISVVIEKSGDCLSTRDLFVMDKVASGKVETYDKRERWTSSLNTTKDYYVKAHGTSVDYRDTIRRHTQNLTHFKNTARYHLVILKQELDFKNQYYDESMYRHEDGKLFLERHNKRGAIWVRIDDSGSNCSWYYPLPLDKAGIKFMTEALPHYSSCSIGVDVDDRHFLPIYIPDELIDGLGNKVKIEELAEKEDLEMSKIGRRIAINLNYADVEITTKLADETQLDVVEQGDIIYYPGWINYESEFDTYSRLWFENNTILRRIYSSRASVQDTFIDGYPFTTAVADEEGNVYKPQKRLFNNDKEIREGDIVWIREDAQWDATVLAKDVFGDKIVAVVKSIDASDRDNVSYKCRIICTDCENSYSLTEEIATNSFRMDEIKKVRHELHYDLFTGDIVTGTNHKGSFTSGLTAVVVEDISNGYMASEPVKIKVLEHETHKHLIGEVLQVQADVLELTGEPRYEFGDAWVKKAIEQPVLSEEELEEKRKQQEREDYINSFPPESREWISKQLDAQEDGTAIDWDSIKIQHTQYQVIKTCIGHKLPVYLSGPAGSGKNHTLEQIAMELGMNFYFANSIQDEFKLIGFKDASGRYHETEFYRACTDPNPCMFFLDEIDASDEEVLVLLNAAIANGYFAFPNGDEKVRLDNVHFVAAGNTMGNGANDLYTGRRQLDQATLDRFVIIEFDYDNDIELKLAEGNVELVSFVRDLREKAETVGIRATFSYRCIQMATTLLKTAMSTAEIIKIAIVKGLDEDTLRTLELGDKDKTVFHKIYDEQVREGWA